MSTQLLDMGLAEAIHIDNGCTDKFGTPSDVDGSVCDVYRAVVSHCLHDVRPRIWNCEANLME